ncbi:hypothetical protein ILYODFUR_009037 [Ilyodon furcidens]|uniref:Uncharacterized protein n=1 Tax=Ilyodon furcidens TaxID=33524 RepID=A0ABV0SXK9_9TELE
MKVLQQKKGSDKRGKDERRQEKVKEGRARMKDDRGENSREKEKCTVINSPSLWGVQAQAEAAPDDKRLPPCTTVLAIYEQAAHENQRASICLALEVSHFGPGDNLK